MTATETAASGRSTREARERSAMWLLLVLQESNRATARRRQGLGEVSPQRPARRRTRVGESEGRSPSE